METINIIAILISPVIALIIGQIIQRRYEERERKVTILRKLIANKDFDINFETIEALNHIKIFFSKKQNVIEKLNQLQADISNKEKFSSLIEEIIKHLGYKNISWTNLFGLMVPDKLKNKIDNEEKIIIGQLELFNKLSKIDELINNMNNSSKVQLEILIDSKTTYKDMLEIQQEYLLKLQQFLSENESESED